MIGPDEVRSDIPWMATRRFTERPVFFPNSLEPGPRQELEKGLAEGEIPVEAVMASGQLVIDERQDEPKKMQDALGNALAEVPGRSCCLLRREAAAEPESGSAAS